MKILLVEDEKKLADALKRGLELQGYTVDIISDGAKAMTRISLHRSDYDVVILDLMLPSMDGHEICKQMRAKDITVPVLILTARAETDTKVQLLMSGADDYLVKPFSFAELNARIHALLRRPNEVLPQVLHSGDIELDPNTRRAVRAGRDIPLTLKEYGLLEYFMRHPDTVVNREDLLTHLWDFNYVGFSNVVDVHVKNLRRKLSGEDVDDVLETVRGIGYRLRG
ncbi:DNA-binding response regulator [Candidatus Kaiserbacteria bacterium RIFCSPHIGHO2_02_FULL_54_11b]|uniref:DNA-binding response regulator n=2 Tax=Candidatus Kaiseribacteriota TaxID=1752734 RepID=A0A1F6CRY5_9BACT|nr:MAG: DNA-binding response regulator [Candidatus Kaiserbacteria bacterium RIFCSPHIGHO2_01_FULL_54_36b]OGG64978.1 MAG: DNA-binding response regulator [Candidatus Kaiserbacteria bacterium RIFCSPHIGHO2_02_FULL_54_11b]